MNGYICFYKDQRTEVRAKTSREAQEKGAAFFRASNPRRKIKDHEISPVLAEKDGNTVTHSTASLG